jgi:hypothetical protein
VSVIRFACGRPRLLGCHANEKQRQTVGRSGLRKLVTAGFTGSFEIVAADKAGAWSVKKGTRFMPLRFFG